MQTQNDADAFCFLIKHGNAAENAERNTFADLPQTDILAFKGVSKMLKYSFGIIVAVFLLFYAGFTAFGAEYDGLEYSIIDGEAVITGFRRADRAGNS